MEPLSPTAETFRRLAHDLRGPLAVISGNVQYLQAAMSDLNESAREGLADIEQACQEIEALLRKAQENLP